MTLPVGNLGTRFGEGKWRLKRLDSSIFLGATQLLGLTLLASNIQEQVQFAESVDGLEPMGERAVRNVFHMENWAKQRAELPFSRSRHREASARS